MEILDGLLEEKGRDPKSVKRTLMTGGLVGKTDEEVREKASGFGMYDLDRLRQRDAVFGTPDEIVENLGKKAEIGVQGVMLQWLNPDDISGLELIAEKVLPQLK